MFSKTRFPEQSEKKTLTEFKHKKNSSDYKGTVLTYNGRQTEDKMMRLSTINQIDVKHVRVFKYITAQLNCIQKLYE